MSLTIDDQTRTTLPDWAVAAVWVAEDKIQTFATEAGIDAEGCISIVRANVDDLKTCLSLKSTKEEHYVILAAWAILKAVPLLKDESDRTRKGFFVMLHLVSEFLLAGRTTSSRELAQLGAKARHIETKLLRDEVVAYWKKEIDPALSNDKAATVLNKHFPLSHRKLAEYVAQAKKELRSASRT